MLDRFPPPPRVGPEPSVFSCLDALTPSTSGGGGGGGGWGGVFGEVVSVGSFVPGWAVKYSFVIVDVGRYWRGFALYDGLALWGCFLARRRFRLQCGSAHLIKASYAMLGTLRMGFCGDVTRGLKRWAFL